MTAEAKKTQKAKVIYSVEGEGSPLKVFREENNEKMQIALYDPEEGIVEIAKDYVNFRSRVSMFLADQSMKFKEFAPIGSEVTPKNVPPRPKYNPRLGMKTKSVVEWYAQHNRQIFLAKYGIKAVQNRIRIDEHTEEIRAESGHMVSTIVRTPVYENIDGLDFDLSKVKSGEQRLIADCKTHLTEKLQDSNSDPDADWELDN